MKFHQEKNSTTAGRNGCDEYQLWHQVLFNQNYLLFSPLIDNFFHKEQQIISKAVANLVRKFRRARVQPEM